MQTITTPVEFNPVRQIGFRRLMHFTRSGLAFTASTVNFNDNQTSQMKHSWLQTVFLNFFIAACMGFLLRLVHVIEIPWMDFKNMMHAHSHVAMLGWLFMLFYGLILDRFTHTEEANKRIHNYLFWAAQLCVVGMMVSFPLQGYGVASIVFTTAHLIISYAVAVRLLRKIRYTGTPSNILVRTALVLMIISTAGVWLLGMIQSGLFGNSVLYYAAIQFFLHFQFNGWFTFATLALVFKQTELSGQPVPRQNFRWFYGLLLTSLVLTYALSVAWSTPEDWLFWVNSAGVIIQLIAMGLFLGIVLKFRDVFITEGDRLKNTLLTLALCSFAVKVLIQTVVVLPQVAVISYTIRQFVVGFIHLTMLGSITMFLLAFLAERFQPQFNHLMVRYGLIFIAIGFVLTEGLLFLQGIFLWMALGFIAWYYELILVGTTFLPLGIMLIILGLNQSAKNKMQPLTQT